MGVCIQWTGPLDWTSRLDHWPGLVDWTTGLENHDPLMQKWARFYWPLL